MSLLLLFSSAPSTPTESIPLLNVKTTGGQPTLRTTGAQNHTATSGGQNTLQTKGPA